MEPIRAAPTRARPAPRSRRGKANSIRPQSMAFNNAVTAAQRAGAPVRILPVSSGVSGAQIITPSSVLRPTVPQVTSQPRVTPIIPSSRPIDVSLGSRVAQQLLNAPQIQPAKTFTLQNPVASGAPASGTTSAIIVPDGSRHSITLGDKRVDSSLRIESVQSNASLLPTATNLAGSEIDIKPMFGVSEEDSANDLFDCDNCKKGFPKLFECTGCSGRWFCSEKCQIEDWETHHETCGES